MGVKILKKIEREVRRAVKDVIHTLETAVNVISGHHQAHKRNVAWAEEQKEQIRKSINDIIVNETARMTADYNLVVNQLDAAKADFNKQIILAEQTLAGLRSGDAAALKAILKSENNCDSYEMFMQACEYQPLSHAVSQFFLHRNPEVVELLIEKGVPYREGYAKLPLEARFSYLAKLDGYSIANYFLPLTGEESPAAQRIAETLYKVVTRDMRDAIARGNADDLKQLLAIDPNNLPAKFVEQEQHYQANKLRYKIAARKIQTSWRSIEPLRDDGSDVVRTVFALLAAKRDVDALELLESVEDWLPKQCLAMTHSQTDNRTVFDLAMANDCLDTAGYLAYSGASINGKLGVNSSKAARNWAYNAEVSPEIRQKRANHLVERHDFAVSQQRQRELGLHQPDEELFGLLARGGNDAEALRRIQTDPTLDIEGIHVAGIAADPNLQEADGQTLVDYAAANGCVETFRYLVEQLGADVVSIRGGKDILARIKSGANHQELLKIVQPFLDRKGSDDAVYITSVHDQAAAARRQKRLGLNSPTEAMFSALAQTYDPNPELAAAKGQTALALIKADPKLDVNGVHVGGRHKPDGQSMADYAAINNSIAPLAYLVKEKFADILQIRGGASIFERAQHSPGSLKLLQDELSERIKKAPMALAVLQDMIAANIRQQQYGLQAPSEQMFHLLASEQDAKAKELIQATANLDIDGVHVASTPELNMQFPEGQTLADYAAKNGCIEALKYLVEERGADITRVRCGGDVFAKITQDSAKKGTIHVILQNELAKRNNNTANAASAANLVAIQVPPIAQYSAAGLSPKQLIETHYNQLADHHNHVALARLATVQQAVFAKSAEVKQTYRQEYDKNLAEMTSHFSSIRNQMMIDTHNEYRHMCHKSADKCAINMGIMVAASFTGAYAATIFRGAATAAMLAPGATTLTTFQAAAVQIGGAVVGSTTSTVASSAVTGDFRHIGKKVAKAALLSAGAELVAISVGGISTQVAREINVITGTNAIAEQTLLQSTASVVARQAVMEVPGRRDGTTSGVSSGIRIAGAGAAHVIFAPLLNSSSGQQAVLQHLETAFGAGVEVLARHGDLNDFFMEVGQGMLRAAAGGVGAAAARGTLDAMRTMSDDKAISNGLNELNELDEIYELENLVVDGADERKLDAGIDFLTTETTAIASGEYGHGDKQFIRLADEDADKQNVTSVEANIEASDVLSFGAGVVGGKAAGDLFVAAAKAPGVIGKVVRGAGALGVVTMLVDIEHGAHRFRTEHFSQSDVYDDLWSNRLIPTEQKTAFCEPALQRERAARAEATQLKSATQVFKERAGSFGFSAGLLFAPVMPKGGELIKSAAGVTETVLFTGPKPGTFAAQRGFIDLEALGSRNKQRKAGNPTILSEKAAIDFIPKGYLDGQSYPKDKLPQLYEYLKTRGADIQPIPVDAKGPGFRASDPITGKPTLYLPENPTVLEIKHELSHYLDYKKLGIEKYSQLSTFEKEKMVLDRLKGNRRIWGRLNQQEQVYSQKYVDRMEKQHYLQNKDGGPSVK